MERDLAALSLDDEEEEIIHIQKELDSSIEEVEFCLAECFLTTSVIHFPAMKIIMTNFWHLVKRVQILDLAEKRFLFRFYYKMDLERVLKGSLWTFNNHLLMLHHLRDNFWVQIHEVPPGFFSEVLARKIGDFLRKFLEYDGSNIRKNLLLSQF
ncbi:hypothetical protein PVK06_043775 [Gossypium arboreum]|uniref:DUF4283 domain-containing protein n=1 Tax=Gossypium arboreum TaxID=29729 RepID=A0ABR0MPS3_GOSAR|nr:hypothetical protein PVK06_043775 [Gossypium arboreum]